MRSSIISRLIRAAVVFGSFTSAACQRGDVGDRAATTVAASGATALIHVDSAAGDVTHDSAATAVAGKWLTDANVLALLTTMSAKQIAAADVELQAWHSDTVRAFAASIARDQAALQHSVDSLAGRLHLTPTAPALAETLTATMQRSIDSLQQVRGAPLDRAFIRQQLAAQSLMSDYAEQLAAVAEQPEVQALSASVAAQVGVQLTRTRTLNAMFMADSAHSPGSADSTAKRTSRHKQ